MSDSQGQYKIIHYPDVVATDSNGNPLPSESVSYSHSSGDRYYVGVTDEVTVTARGFNNNMATCTFSIEVRPFCKYVTIFYCYQVVIK